MPYTDQGLPHAGSAEVLVTGMFDEPAGTLARTLSWGLVSGGGLSAYTTGGQVACRGIALPAGLPVTNLQVFIGNTGATAPSHFWLALLDIGLNVLAVSADQGAAAQAANTPIKLPMTGPAPYIVPQTGRYYVAASSSAATTAPTAGGIVMLNGSLAIASPPLCGTAGNQATPPAVGTQLNSGTVTASVNCNFAAWIS